VNLIGSIDSTPLTPGLVCVEMLSAARLEHQELIVGHASSAVIAPARKVLTSFSLM